MISGLARMFRTPWVLMASPMTETSRQLEFNKSIGIEIQKTNPIVHQMIREQSWWYDSLIRIVCCSVFQRHQPWRWCNINSDLLLSVPPSDKQNNAKCSIGEWLMLGLVFRNWKCWHIEISLGEVNSELNTEDVVLEPSVEIDVIAVFLQEIVCDDSRDKEEEVIILQLHAEILPEFAAQKMIESFLINIWCRYWIIVLGFLHFPWCCIDRAELLRRGSFNGLNSVVWHGIWLNHWIRWSS